MTQWYYANEGQQIGPIEEPEFKNLIAAGGITPETQVWTEGFEQWVPAGEIEGLIPSAAGSLPAADGLPEQSFQHQAFPETITDGSLLADKAHAEAHKTQAKAHKAQAKAHAKAEKAELKAQKAQVKAQLKAQKAQIWNRFWARGIDSIVFSCFISVFLVALAPSTSQMHFALYGALLLFVYHFLEPVMLSSWGSTPGKALLRITVRRADGAKLSYSEALKRSFRIWLRGEGLGLPIINIIALLKARANLKNNGITSWDEEDGFTVTHGKVGFFRNLVAVLIIILSGLLSSAGNAEF